MKRSQGVIGTLVLGLLATASAVNWSTGAHACGVIPPTCTPPVRLFPIAEVPGDQVYFKLLVDAPGGLTLRDSDGRLIDADVRTIGSDRVFAPRAALEPGRTLTLSYTTVCPAPNSWSPPLSPSTQTFTFKTRSSGGPAGNPPNAVLYEIGLRLPGTFNEERFARVAYDSPAGADLEHLQDIFVSIDGKRHYFASQHDRTQLWPSYLELRSRCSEPERDQLDSCGAVSSYAAGEHEVEIWSTIVGASVQPAHGKLTVKLACDSAPVPVADAGASCAPGPQPEARATVAPNVPSARQDTDAFSNSVDDALSVDDESKPEPVSEQSTASGCALGGDGSGANAAFGLGALVALIARRRRRHGPLNRR